MTKNIPVTTTARQRALPALLWLALTLVHAVAAEPAVPVAQQMVAANDPSAFANEPVLPITTRTLLAENTKPVPAREEGHSSALFAANDKLAVPDGLTAPPPPLEVPKASDLPPPTPVTPSQNATVNLIRKLVEKGILSNAEAAEMIQQAEAEAVAARELAAAVAPPGDDTVRVTYIPENVKAEMRDQIKDEVMARAKDEHWAYPGVFPEWPSRIKLFGDIRMRYEGNYFPKGNDNTGAFPNFNAINTGSPFDVSGTVFSPQRNVDQERERIRLTAHIGADINLGDNFTAGLRIGTGDSNTPVSNNQSFGLANQGQGGNFSKYSIWLDRAFIKYEAGGLPTKNLALLFGRFDNPFFCSPMLWDDDIGFDGVALTAKYEVFRGFTPFLTVGAFPVFNTDLNFSSNQPAKYESSDKWLYAGQVGFDVKVNKDFSAKFAAAIYDFKGVEGRVSDPYTPLTAQDASNTDNTRPSFAQAGNTYMALRNIIPSSLNNYGTSQQYQYFGLATPFRELSYTGRIDINAFEPVQITLLGEYVKNLSYNKSAIDAIAVNNRGPNPVPTPVDPAAAAAPVAAADGTTPEQKPAPVGPYAGGDTAWFVKAQIGKSVFEKAGDWNASFGYRYAESDALVDAFADSDFGLGGTNLKGITIGAAVALSPRVKLGVTWMSATQIAGPPSKVDVLMIDLTAKF